MRVGPTPPDRETLDVEIARLRDLDVGGLRHRWHAVWGRPPPSHLPRHLLFRILAYRLQADRWGDLDADSKRLLDRSESPERAGQSAVALGRHSAELPPGTVLGREWNGKMQRVTDLHELVQDRPRDHRHALEWAAVFWPAGQAGQGLIGLMKKQARCAIYTRVSTDQGLEQDLNSLDAQYEASQAYIRSQAHAGWRLLRTKYDDGGFSGGNTDRPALQRLLEDLRSGKVDVIVVYKVDRLTRSPAAHRPAQSDSRTMGHWSRLGRRNRYINISGAEVSQYLGSLRIIGARKARQHSGRWPSRWMRCQLAHVSA